MFQHCFLTFQEGPGYIINPNILLNSCWVDPLVGGLRVSGFRVVGVGLKGLGARGFGFKGSSLWPRLAQICPLMAFGV